MPKHAQADVKADYWAIFDDIDAAPGTAAQAEACRRAKRFATKWRSLYPAAVECLEDDFEHLITYLRFPTEHWKRIRHSNFIERTFGETRRRVKVIGRLPGEQSCLSLVWAVLDQRVAGVARCRDDAGGRAPTAEPATRADRTAARTRERGGGRRGCHTRRVEYGQEPRQSAFTPSAGRHLGPG